MVSCYLGIGSNLGNRKKNISLALKKIRTLKEIKLIKVSRVIKTSPVGGPAVQQAFLNAALKIKTGLLPLKLLRKLQDIERQLGRPKKHTRYGPRTIDLDILFYGDKVVERKALKIPHPKIFAREFVVQPLLEVI